MRRDARPEIERNAIKVIALARRTVGAALLETGDMRVAVVPAARTLREIAAERRQTPDLRRRKAGGGGGKSRKSLGDPIVRSDGGDRRRGADSQSSSSSPDNRAHLGCRNDIDERAVRDATAASLREIRAGRAEFGRLGDRNNLSHAAVLALRRPRSRSGRIGISYG